MKKYPFNDNWNYIPGETSFFSLMMQKGTPVTLPHDAQISAQVSPSAPAGKDGGFFPGMTASYIKEFTAPEEWKGQRILLAFDGVYGNTEVTLNGYFCGLHHYGYTPFYVDLTERIKPGEKNRIVVTANNTAQPSGRWYTGTGIYRNVSLLTSPQIHIAPHGIYAYTRYLKEGNAYLSAEVTLENHTAHTCKQFVRVTLREDTGRGTPAASVAAEGYMVIQAAPGESSGKVNLIVKNPKVWDLDSPSLYRIQAELYEKQSDKENSFDFITPDGKAAQVTDQAESLFGIRTITIERDHGLQLNGQSIKCKGGCIHSDNGILGAASFYDSEYRKMKLHKSQGFNAIRCAHNPPSTEMLEACDRLGLLVLDEAFDVWEMGKNSCDYHLYFASDWEQDLSAMLKRDRNHPCVFMWSIGNEITERNGLGNGAEYSAKLAALVRQYDPTRPVTSSMPVPFNGLNDSDMIQSLISLQKKLSQGNETCVQNLGSEYSCSILPERSEAYMAPLDVFSFNYLDYMYEDFGRLYPNSVICGTESYPASFSDVWQKVENLPYVIGDFTWTSYDYIGEAGLGIQMYTEEPLQTNPLQGPPVNYPWRLAYCADFDLCGEERPQLHLRKTVWGDPGTYVWVHNPENYNKYEMKGRWGWSECYPCWSFPGCEGKMTKIDVFSAADEVELLVNGVSIGVKPAGRSNGCHTQFEIPYTPGTLTALSKTDGIEISRQTLTTAGEAIALRLTCETTSLAADAQSLAFVKAEIVDENGQRIYLGSDVSMTAAAEGCGTLLAFGDGRPCTDENYTTGSFTAFHGYCMAVLRSSETEGDLRLTVNAKGMPSQSITISVK